MKKILTKEETEKKSHRNKVILSVILGFLMLFSTAGYALYSFNSASDSVNKIKYNNIKFSLLDDGYWHFTVAGNEFISQNTPVDTANISVSNNLKLSNYNQKALYFSYDSDKQGVNEILINLNRFILKSQYVCIEDCSENLPIKNCSDNIIIIRDINASSIRQEDNCVYIMANSDNVIKASDKFIFSILGV